MAHDVAELAQACDLHWEDGKFHLYRGDFEERLRKWGRTDLESKTAVLRRQFVNQDVGLDAFIRLLDPAYPPSAIQVTPELWTWGVCPGANNARSRSRCGTSAEAACKSVSSDRRPG